MLLRGGKLGLSCCRKINFFKVQEFKKYAQTAIASPAKCITPDFFCANARFLSNFTHSSTVSSKDSFCENIINFKSSGETLDYLKGIDWKLLNEKNACSIASHVCQRHYKQLINENGNLHSNMHIAYFQLLLHGKISEVMEPIHSNENFVRLCKILDENYDTIAVDEVNDALLSLILLNVPHESNLIFKLISRLYNDAHLLDIGGLAKLSFSVKSLPGLQSTLAKKSVDGMKFCVETNDNPTLGEVCHVANIAINLVKFISCDTLKNVNNWIVKFIPSLNINDHVECISTLMKFFNVCQRTNDIEVSSETLNNLEDASCNAILLLDCYSIHEICKSMKTLRRFNGRLNHLMEKRIIDLLNDKTRLADLLCIMSALSKMSSRQVLKSFENALFTKLIEQESLDAVLLSNISETLLDLKISNVAILEHFHKHVVENSETLLSYISRFNKVSKLLIRSPFSDPEQEKKFVQVVLQYMDGAYGLSMQLVTCLGIYLLSLKNFSLIPHHTYTKLISSLSSWEYIPLCKLFTTIDLTLSTCSREKKQHFVELIGRVQQILAHKLSENPLKNTLFLTNSPLASSQKYFNSSMSNVIINSFKDVAGDLNCMKLRKMLPFMHHSNYYVPEIFEEVLNHVLPDTGNDDVVVDLLRVFSKANYRPLKMKEFIDQLVNIYKKNLDNKLYYDSMTILNNLSILGYFPKKELKEFFKGEIIDGLEELTKGSRAYPSLEFMLMNLNRNVVIECPELGIPWFHEQYCQKLFLRTFEGSGRNKETFNDEVFSSLVDVFGGSKYIKRNSFSPYFHKIDFECVFDSHNKLIPIIGMENKIYKDFQRVAICIQHERSFCKDSRVPSGNEDMRIRQLKMLNYKVIEVPFFEWYSMGMSERSTKIKFLKEKFIDSGLWFLKRNK